MAYTCYNHPYLEHGIDGLRGRVNIVKDQLQRKCERCEVGTGLEIAIYKYVCIVSPRSQSYMPVTLTFHPNLSRYSESTRLKLIILRCNGLL